MRTGVIKHTYPRPPPDREAVSKRYAADLRRSFKETAGLERRTDLLLKWVNEARGDE